MPASVFDAVVVGGGAAGATAALQLRRQGWSVLLADAGTPATAVGETLLPAARLLLERLGLWCAFERAGHAPCHGGRARWGSSAEVGVDHLFNPYGAAHVVDRAAFDAMLREAAAAEGVAVHRPATAAPVADGGASPALRLTEAGASRTITARWVVDATGRRAAVARHYGARRTADDTLVCAALAVPAARLAASGTTFVEAGELGFWYRVVGRDGQAVVALFTDADLLKRAGAHRLVGWLHLYRATQGADELPITADSLVRPLCVRAAASGRLAPVAGPHWIAVGDAALTLDPLSSRGLAAAMAGGIHAATALAARRAGGTTDPAGYARALADIHHRHLADRRAYYGLEWRWPDAAFWRRRAAAPALGVSP